MSTPPTMRVAVELGFVAGCAECLSIVEATGGAAFRDQQVTRFVAVPGKKHAHASQGKSGASQHLEATSGAPTGALEGQMELPVSDTNGSNPEDVDRVIAAVRGFDPEGRDEK